MSAAHPLLVWCFLVDENLPRSLVPELTALGHVAEHVYDIGMAGTKDPAVYAYAQAQQATIITGDKDFSNIRVYPPPHASLIVVEVPDTVPPDARKRIIVRQLATLAGQSLAISLATIEAHWERGAAHAHVSAGSHSSPGKRCVPCSPQWRRVGRAVISITTSRLASA